VLVKEEDEADPAPTTLGRPGVLLDVVTDDPDELAGIAQDNGAAVVFPVADQPYGARGGRIRDPFGHEWLLQTPLSMTPEQVQHALNEAAGD
jgi:PhnB protein